MKIFLDDTRDAPEGWVLAKTADKAINLLRLNKVECISLDYDLGSFYKTGYDVLRWIEDKIYLSDENFKVPEILIHTQNPVGRARMQAGLDSIKRKLKEK